MVGARALPLAAIFERLILGRTGGVGEGMGERNRTLMPSLEGVPQHAVMALTWAFG
jgi:hypothetical protein